MKKTEIEIQRNNVTVSQFLAYVRSQCKKKGLELWADSDVFKTGENQYHQYWKKNGKIYSINYLTGWKWEIDDDDLTIKSELYRSLPYDYQVYVLYGDGTLFNEIIEFTFDDEKTGHGYYYQINVLAEEEKQA